MAHTRYHQETQILNNTPAGEKWISRGIALCIALYFIFRIAAVSCTQFSAPFDLVFETPNLSSIRLLQKGINIYDPAVYQRVPFIITMYTPLYHYLVAALPESEANPFFTGRLVSAAAMVLAAASLFLLRPGRTGRWLSILAFGLYFSFWPVIGNTAFLKNDSLALCFSAFAIITVFNHKNRPGMLILAALLSVLAIATKQSFVSAALTCTLYLLLTAGRRSILIFVSTLLTLSAAFTVLGSLLWGEGFWYSTITTTHLPITFQQTLSVISKMLRQPLFWFVIILSGLRAVDQLRLKGIALIRESPYFLYACVSALVLSATLGKNGSSDNYFIEFLLALLMWLVWSHDKQSLGLTVPRKAGMACLFLFCVVLEVCSAKSADYAFATGASVEAIEKYYVTMRKDIESLGIKDPSILNLISHVNIYSVSNESYFNDPLLYMMLWKEKLMDPGNFIQSITDQYYDIIIIPEKIPGVFIKDKPCIKPVLKAMVTHYTLALNRSGQRYFIRKRL